MNEIKAFQRPFQAFAQWSLCVSLFCLLQNDMLPYQCAKGKVRKLLREAWVNASLSRAIGTK